MARATVFYSGRVQGVGFRATVRQLACGYEINGTVRNLEDGRVELIAEGERAEVEAFLTAIAESDLSGYINARPESWGEAQGMRGFRISR